MTINKKNTKYDIYPDSEVQYTLHSKLYTKITATYTILGKIR